MTDFPSKDASFKADGKAQGAKGPGPETLLIEDACGEDAPLESRGGEGPGPETLLVEDALLETNEIEDLAIESLPVEEAPLETAGENSNAFDEDRDLSVSNNLLEDRSIEDAPLEKKGADGLGREAFPVEDAPLETPVENPDVFGEDREPSLVDLFPAEDGPLEEGFGKDGPVEDAPLGVHPAASQGAPALGEDAPREKAPGEALRVREKRRESAQAIRSRQRHLLWAMGSLLMGGMLLYGWTVIREAPFADKREYKSSLLTGSSRINFQEAWAYQIAGEMAAAQKRLEALESGLSKLLKAGAATPESEKPFPGVSSPLPLPEASPASLAKDLQEDLKSESGAALGPDALKGSGGRGDSWGGGSLPSDSSPAGFAGGETLPLSPSGVSRGPSLEAVGDYSSFHGEGSGGAPFRSKAVRKISLSLRNAPGAMPLKTVDNTAPAGSFARAVLLGGVDASAAVQASSNPRPALLRLTDAGTLPRRFRSDLKGCHVLAACYGDISSERVFMRLEKLACIERKTGEIVEIRVQGYVAGEDGRTGIRGSVVDRAGESMRNAILGGFLSGIGEFFSQSRPSIAFSPIAGLTPEGSLGAGQILKHGAGKGASAALEKYADFYIKRAEQVQPVIQAAAGRQVDIVFTEGVSLGDSAYRQSLGRSQDQKRYRQIQSAQEGPLPLSRWTGAPEAEGPDAPAPRSLDAKSLGAPASEAPF